MKKIITLVLALLMLVSLAACGTTSNTPSGNQGSTPADQQGTNTPGNSSSQKVADFNSDGKIDFRDYLYNYAKNGGVKIEAKQTSSSKEKTYIFTSDGKDIQVEWNGKKTYYDFTAKKVYVDDGSGWKVNGSDATKFDEGFEKIFSNKIYMSEISNSWTSYTTYEKNLEKVGSKTYAGRECTEYTGSSGTFYVDNETGLTLYQDSSYIKLETISFTTGATLTKPAE